MPRKPGDFLTRLNAVPPCIVRLHAIDSSSGRPRLLTNGELARKSGLSQRTVLRLSHRDSWSGLDPKVIDMFMTGCDASMFDLKWYDDFINKYADTCPPFSHVTDSRMRKTLFRVMKWGNP